MKQWKIVHSLPIVVRRVKSGVSRSDRCISKISLQGRFSMIRLLSSDPCRSSLQFRCRSVSCAPFVIKGMSQNESSNIPFLCRICKLIFAVWSTSESNFLRRCKESSSLTKCPKSTATVEQARDRILQVFSCRQSNRYRYAFFQTIWKEFWSGRIPSY